MSCCCRCGGGLDPFPAPPPVLTRLVAAAQTDVGRERSNNEDRAAFGDASLGVVLEPPAAAMLIAPPGMLWALVCDGMGGEAGGEIASGLAIETIPEVLAASLGGGCRAPAPRGEAGLAAALVASIEAASERIGVRARHEPKLRRMGTT